MLEPLTILSLAGNVVQFIQFGCGLAVKAHGIYSSSSGASEENLEMESVVSRLLRTVDELDRLTAVGTLTSPDSVPKSSRRLLEIADSCKTVAQDILNRLEKLKLKEPRSVGRSFGKALKSIWTKDELYALMRRLKAYISELDTTILISMKLVPKFRALDSVHALTKFNLARHNIDLLTFRTTQNFYKLDQSAQRIVDLLLLNRSIFTSELRSQTKEIKGVVISEQAQTRAMILELIQRKGIAQATSASYVQSAAGSESALDAGSSEDNRINNLLIESLGFASMDNRQEEIVRAHDATFEWIFQESNAEPDSSPWTNFAQWLRHDDGIYWINGKAGSGKTTLMKFIYNHVRTSQILSEWTGSIPVLVAAFFFWNSGTREQRSQTGLLRFLLFQILQHRPALVRQVFPEEYAILQDRMNSSADKSWHTWSLRRLQNAAQRLFKLPDLPIKLCLLIDGLDEFEGNDDQNDHRHLTELFKSFASSNLVKICVSSRPLVVFEEAFKTCPGLRLQDLTSGDIRRYAMDRLSDNPKVQRITDDHSSQRQTLVTEICRKAQGVFLWVKLVVRSLLEGLSNSDRLADLRARLDLLPADLEDLYRHMLAQTEKVYSKAASEVFQMVRIAGQVRSLSRRDNQRTTPVTVLLLALATDETEITHTDTGSEYWTSKRLSDLCDSMRRRLQTWCAGLFEVPDFLWNRVDPLDFDAALRTKITWEIAYIHRTAKDFIESKSVWSTIMQETEATGFNPHVSLLKSTTLLYKVAGSYVSNPLGYGLYRKELLEPIAQALIFAQRAEAETEDNNFELLNELDIVTGCHLFRWTGDFVGHWSNFLEISVPLNTFSSFLDVAVFYGLHRYVLTKISSDYYEYCSRYKISGDAAFVRGYFKQDPQDPGSAVRSLTLLDLALRPEQQSPKMAQILLEHGADPNEKTEYGRTPIWDVVLKRAQARSAYGAYDEKWLWIIQLFIQHDVDMKGDHRLRDARTRALDVVEPYGSKYPAEVALIREAIDEKLPVSMRGQLRVWATEKLGPSRK